MLAALSLALVVAQNPSPPPVWARAISFQYTPGSAVGDENERTVLGFEPTSPGPHPVYMYLTGGGLDLTLQTATLEYARTMATLGFVAVNAESDFQVATWCSGSPAAMEPVAEAVFGYGGVGDTTSQGLLATLCRRPNVDCSRGVAVHGFSMGGLLVALAARYAPSVVTASLVWGAGVTTSGTADNVRVDAGVTVTGASPLECVRDAALSQYLPRSRRRIVIGGKDEYYGNANGGGAFLQCQQSSGVDCGPTERNCLQADGSGYYVPDLTHEVAAYDSLPNEPYGTAQSLQWLADTARPASPPLLPPAPPMEPSPPSPPPEPSTPPGDTHDVPWHQPGVINLIIPVLILLACVAAAIWFRSSSAGAAKSESSGLLGKP